jgi:hypothetical protein
LGALGARVEAVRAEVTAAATDHGALVRLTADLDDLMTRTAAAEERWLEIAAEAEAAGMDPGPPPG